MKDRVVHLSFDQAVDRILATRPDFHRDYLAMYSSWYGGIVTDPALMMVPIDDHLVHRGDGVFEALKSVEWHIYGLQGHLQRMKNSLAALSLPLPMGWEELTETIVATVRAANEPNAVIRIFVSRGPGGFSVNPYECPASQLYIVVSRFHGPPESKYEEGTVLKTSRIPIKRDYFARIKSCNYLPNVLMRKEAEDARVDFTVSVDEQGNLGEGPTENVGLVTEDRRFLVPRFERILRGTTVTRVLELAESMVASGHLTEVGEMNITPRQAYEAAELMMFGTTFDVLPVVRYDDHVIGTGRPGPFFRMFLTALREDMRHNSRMLTFVEH